MECAVEISRVLKHYPISRCAGGAQRPVSAVTDVNGRVNAAGVGINVAQRLMDCGDPVTSCYPSEWLKICNRTGDGDRICMIWAK